MPLAQDYAACTLEGLVELGCWCQHYKEGCYLSDARYCGATGVPTGGLLSLGLLSLGLLSRVSCLVAPHLG